jgi:hypothetical protein
VFSEGKELAPQVRRKNELSNGEFGRTGILQLVNHAGEFGNASVSNGRLDCFFYSVAIDLSDDPLLREEL